MKQVVITDDVEFQNRFGTHFIETKSSFGRGIVPIKFRVLELDPEVSFLPKKLVQMTVPKPSANIL
jgi:hypothetical protein